MIAPVKEFKELQRATKSMRRLPIAAGKAVVQNQEVLGVKPSDAVDAWDGLNKIGQDTAALKQDTAAINTFVPGVSTAMNVARQIDQKGNGAFMALEIGFPIASNISAGAVGLMAGGAGMVGLTGGQRVLGKAKTGIMAPLNFLDNHKLGEYTAGGVYAKAVDVVVSPVYAVAKAINDATNWFSKNAARLDNKAQTHLQTAEGHAAEVMAHAPAPVGEKFTQYMAAHSFGEHEAAAKAGEELSALMSAHKVDKVVHKAVGKFTKHVGKANAATQGAKTWEEFAAGAHNTASGVAGTSLRKGASNSLLGLTAATSGAITTHDIVSDVNAYRHMVADITNQSLEDVSASEALFGSMPFAAGKARAALLANAVPRGLLEGLNAVFNIKAIKTGHWGLGMMIAPLASQMIGTVTGGNVLDVYKEMKANELSGTQNTPEQFTKLIGLASKELHDRGAADSEFAQAIGESYAKRGYTVKQTLQAVTSGQLSKELQVLREQHDTPQGYSHVEALKQEEKSRTLPEKGDKAAFGEHSMKVMQQAVKPAEAGIA